MTTAANETEMTLVQAVTDALACEMRLDDRVIILGEDVGINGGVFRATEGLHRQFDWACHERHATHSRAAI